MPASASSPSRNASAAAVESPCAARTSARTLAASAVAAGTPRPATRASSSADAPAAASSWPRLELGLHDDGEQLRHPETVGRHQPQAAAGRGARQVEVAALQQQPSRRQERMDAVVPP